MEHVAGGSLANLRVVAPARAARLVASAARGLGAAHARGIVHRDVKPGNLLLVDADGDEVKVADFGVAKLVGSDPLTREGTLVGTVGYLAPEQIDGDADARTDVYALGVTLYRLLTGVLPWSGTAAEMMAAALLHGVPDPRAVVAGVPEALAKAVQTLGAVDPDRRPRDGADAAKLLADAG
jgi:serine/threonine-protein kinase